MVSMQLPNSRARHFADQIVMSRTNTTSVSDYPTYYAPYRMYGPNSARWMTRDPLGMVDGPNEYGYVGGNPTTDNDILGQSVTRGMGEQLRHEQEKSRRQKQCDGGDDPDNTMSCLDTCTRGGHSIGECIILCAMYSW